MSQPGKFKVSSSAVANFVEGVLLIELIEYGERFTLNLKPEDGLKWSISPEWVDDKRWKSSHTRTVPPLTEILSNQKTILSLISFIEATERLRDK
jgi:hypothetical protein